MASRFDAFVIFGVLSALALTLSGCGPTDPPGTMVKGRIIENGEPISAPRADVGYGIVNVALHPVGAPAGRSVEASSAEADGSFTLVGPGSGIVPGEYVVVLSKVDENGEHFPAKFRSSDKSPIKVTIPEGDDHDLGDIDVAKY